jgi:hypothetical protein
MEAVAPIAPRKTTARRVLIVLLVLVAVACARYFTPQARR